MRKTALFTALLILCANPVANAHEPYSAAQVEWQSQISTQAGASTIPLKIGHKTYTCAYDPNTPYTVISDNIYRYQRSHEGLRRLGRKARIERGLPRHTGERYLRGLNVTIGQTRLALPNPIISKYNEGNGICLGISSSRANADITRRACHFGIKLSISFISTSDHWCVVGQDAITAVEPVYSSVQIRSSPI